MLSSAPSHQGERVGYLDPQRGFSSGVFSPPRAASAPVLRAAPSSSSHPHQYPMQLRQSLPQEVRLISHSGPTMRPAIPVPAPATLPSVSESPLSLLAAATGGTLDLQWLESFDNVTLESLVPRDPLSGRPLTIGSMEHGEGKCRPCIFFLKAKCFKGLRCTFCHFNHTTMRKQMAPPDTNVPISNQSGTTAAKSKRLRPSKRTREMIKQINEQMLFDELREDPFGPPLSVSTAFPQTVHPYR